MSAYKGEHEPRQDVNPLLDRAKRGGGFTTERELARAIGVSPETLSRMRHRGRARLTGAVRRNIESLARRAEEG